jgi:hypothetical protein
MSSWFYRGRIVRQEDCKQTACPLCLDEEGMGKKQRQYGYVLVLQSSFLLWKSGNGLERANSRDNMGKGHPNPSPLPRQGTQSKQKNARPNKEKEGEEGLNHP